MTSPDVRAVLRAAFAPILDAANIGRDAQLHALVGIAVEKLAAANDPIVNGVEPADDLADEGWIAKQLNLSRARCAQLRRANQLGGVVRLGQRKIAYSKKAFAAWLAAGGGAIAEAKQHRPRSK